VFGDEQVEEQRAQHHAGHEAGEDQAEGEVFAARRLVGLRGFERRRPEEDK